MLCRTGQALIDQREEAALLDLAYGQIARERVALELRAARILLRMEAIDGWHCAGSSSAGDFGERHGITAWDARNQLAMGRAIEVEPVIEEKVRARAIPVLSAALLGQVLTDPRLQRDGDTWIEWAERESTKVFRRRVQRRKEEAAVAGPVVSLCLHVTETTLEGFHRCREIASRKAGVPQTQGQTLAAVVECYRDAYDPDRVKPGKRRMPDTRGRPGRGIAAEVKREVRARTGGRCAVPFCDNSVYVDFAHMRPHRLGSAREAKDILDLCREHHGQFDAGYLKLTGTVANPKFTDYAGRDLSRRCAPPGRTDGWKDSPNGTTREAPGGPDPP
jgi:hypothetical protein